MNTTYYDQEGDLRDRSSWESTGPVQITQDHSRHNPSNRPQVPNHQQVPQPALQYTNPAAQAAYRPQLPTGHDEQSGDEKTIGIGRRAPLACRRCRKRKIACSGDPGPELKCTKCTKAGKGVACDFSRVGEVTVEAAFVQLHRLQQPQQRRAQIKQPYAPQPPDFTLPETRQGIHTIEPPSSLYSSIDRQLSAQTPWNNYAAFSIHATVPTSYCVPTCGIQEEHRVIQSPIRSKRRANRGSNLSLRRYSHTASSAASPFHPPHDAYRVKKRTSSYTETPGRSLTTGAHSQQNRRMEALASAGEKGLLDERQQQRAHLPWDPQAPRDGSSVVSLPSSGFFETWTSYTPQSIGPASTFSATPTDGEIGPALSNTRATAPSASTPGTSEYLPSSYNQSL